MLKLPLILVVAVMTALLTCTEATPTSNPTVTPAPTSIAAATAMPANTPIPEATATPTPIAERTPTERPTDAREATPTRPPTSEPTPEPAPGGRLAPLHALDSGAALSELSDAELQCIDENPERQTRFFGCLNDETLARVFLAGFVPGPEPLSQESSDCVRAAFAVIDPRAVMTAGIEADPGRAMAGSMAAFSVTMACLNDEEWETAGPQVGMGPGEREGMQCLMEALGGPGQMAGAMTAAQEGEFAELANAGAECGLDMGPMPPAPTAPIIAATPVPAPATPMPTPTATATTVPSTPAPTMATNTLVITVAPIPTGIPDYDRSDWRHWVDADGDCQDARQEVLIEESLEPVTYETDRQCRVATGQWWAPHLGHHLGNPGHIDVDHHVPLKNAHDSGGWNWDAERKQEYANYLGEENHLVAISSRHNRSKGARGPEEWAPPDNAQWCDYATDWAEIKERWNLTMTPVESEMVMDMLGTCENPPVVVVEIREAMEVRVGVLDPTAEPEGTVYGSCEEAAEAGEQRVQGSQGGGQGFPTTMVPTARDGDGDGVVCER